MANIQVRKFPDDIYERIAQSAAKAERSVEGEVRYALAMAYPAQPDARLSLRERWQLETAQRLQQLIDQLEADGFWHHRGPGGVLHMARLMGEPSPAYLLDCLDGATPLTWEAAKRLSASTGVGENWLLDGLGDMFPVEDIGNHYDQFFRPETPGNYRFHLFRIGHQPGLKPLLCIRHNRADNTYAMGRVMGQFYLGDGMGATGMGNLKRFLQYLKKHSARLRWDAYLFDSENADTGNHHPCFYLNGVRHTESTWLESMLNGETPTWLTEFSWYAEEVKNAPFGDSTPVNGGSHEKPEE